jgi:hypothetical protein
VTGAPRHISTNDEPYRRARSTVTTDHLAWRFFYGAAAGRMARYKYKIVLR